MGTLFRRSRSAGRSNWLAEYTDHNGDRVQKSTRVSDKKTAQQILSHWEAEAAKRSSGLIDHAAERLGIQASRPIQEHKDEWISSLRSGGRSKVHVDRSGSRLQKAIDFTGWASAKAITPESVESFSAALREMNRSHQTISHYLQAIKQFTRWLSMTGRIPRNPLGMVKKPNPKKDRRRERRMLLPAEWSWLSTAAEGRAIIYETAIQTGLRSGEIRSLQASHVKHDAKQPYVLVKGGVTKDSKLARQYVTASLATKLGNHKPHSRTKFFDLPGEYDMASLLRDDLRIARIMWLEREDHTKEDLESDFLMAKNDAREQLDFHSLRHTCGAWLALQGVHPKTIQTIMRHKSITLTMDTYGHLFPNAEPDAVAKLGVLLSQ